MDVFDLIQQHEGLRLRLYKDTMGNLTIGYGRCISCKGISVDEARFMLESDVGEVEDELKNYAWYNMQNEPRQAVLLDMAYNLGVHGLLHFTTMIDHLSHAEFAEAAEAMRNSEWASQVKSRAIQDAEIIEKGIWI